MSVEIQELIKKGELDKALEISLKKYQETKDEKIYNLYGIVLFKKKMYDEASQVFKELYSKHPENEKLLVNYVLSLMERGALEDAERALREGAMIFPESSRILELLAECERRKDLKKEELNKKQEKAKVSEKAQPKPEEEAQQKEEEPKMQIEPERKAEDVFEFEELERIEEKITDEIEIERPGEVKEPKKEEVELEEKFRELTVEQEKISLEQSPELPDGFLKRARIVELNLIADAEFVARSTFVLSISGLYKVFPLKDKQANKIKKTPFGGKKHSFVKIRGERAQIMIGGEYISFIDISDGGKLMILEPYLVGFESRLQYNTIPTEIKKIGRINLTELTGQGKVLIFSANKKLVIRDFENRIRISIPNFVGFYGEGEIDFLQDSVQIRGRGRAIIRI